MNTPPFEYVGSELDVFSEAHNWRQYWASRVRPFLGTRVLEVGAGIGSVTRLLYQQGMSWTALEPDPNLASRIAIGQEKQDGLHVRVSSIDELPKAETYDSILYIDVLEHIEDDRNEIDEAYQRLAPGGSLIILAPAHQWLFTPFDASIGHYRRYSRVSLRQLKPKTAKEILAVYLDAAGVLASTANRVLLRTAHPSRKQIQFWDRSLIPISRRVDPLVRHHVGKSVLLMWSKPSSEGGQP